ncbi:LOW QUALITY PROTEIN: hypothetical protein PHMEG_00030825 [Phytophthora megakarya]|uniref:Uncharacterized protein n=1 Tax=Phytophthora megakarya TaxID=4795 RepID=A0A225UZD5_9STRA|nr:LOW QUALITY PROTEIN: hypothetical protein PHMEG_00030825 [Phytophthora megakarya]
MTIWDVLAQETQLNSIPVEHFAHLQPPSRHVFMDASDTGVCVLEPQLKQYIRVQFSAAVRETFAHTKTDNSINVRELMSVALAALHWGPAWAPTGRDRTHIQMWIDNTSAVAWLEKRSSHQPLARAYNRVISLSEIQHSFTCSAAHIRGEHNTMADAGSRAWSTDHPLFTVWTNLSDSWSPVPILPPFDNLLSLWEMFSANMLLHGQLPGSIQRTGANGANSHTSWSPLLTEPGKEANNKKLDCFAIYCWKHGWNQSRHGNTFSTIKLKLASIRWYHKRHLGIDVITSPDFTILLQGIKRLSPPVHKLQPITPAFLRLLYHRLDLQQPHHRLLWGSVLVGFFFLLRRSEYLRIGQSCHFYCLKHQNAFFSDAEGRRTTEYNATSVTIGLEGAKMINLDGGVANNARIRRPGHLPSYRS